MEVAADIRNDGDEFVELLGSFGIDVFVEFWPVLRNEESFGPAEGLPDGLGDKWREWMEHDKDFLESILEKVGVLPEFFAFEEPVGVFVPDKVIEQVAGFSKAIVLEKLVELFVGAIDFAANPVFAKRGFFWFWFAFVFINDGLDETADVPKLIAEVATSDNFTGAEGLIDASAA